MPWGFRCSSRAVKRGAILLGACDGARLVGFVYSYPGLKDGRPMQWSHMLGVRPEFRTSGIGRALKLEQRRISLAMGIDLMEWTFNPSVTVNALPERPPPRRGGRRLRGERLRRFDEPAPQGRADGPLSSRNGGCARRAWRPHYAGPWRRAPQRPAAMCRCVNQVERRGDWLACTGFELGRREPRLAVTIPARFTEMLVRQPDAAHAWDGLAFAEMFSTYLAHRYQVIDFSFAPGADRGAYLLEAGPAGT